MRKITIMLSLMLMASLTWAQIYSAQELAKMQKENGLEQNQSLKSEQSPIASAAVVGTQKATWDILYNWTVNAAGQQGIGFDGTNFYTAKWGTAGGFAKYSNQGVFQSEFVIAGVGGIRDLTHDGEYFYGGASTAVLYKLDLATQTMVGSVTTVGGNIRHCSFDPTADNGNGGFWVGDWTTLRLVNRTGAVLTTVSTAVASVYGSAYDDVTEGGPYLWLFTQEGTDNRVNIKQFRISDLTFTGVVKIANDIPGYNAVDGIAGGLFAYKDMSSGKFVLAGNIQQDPNIVFGYELGILANTSAPAAPTAVAVVPAAAGALSATINWTNPSTTVAGAALTELTAVKVYRGETLIHTVSSPTIGGAETFVDNTVPASGSYTYTVKGENTSGIGLASTASSFIGVDVPGAPQTLVLTATGNNGTITWAAPVAGLNGGYFDVASVTYTIKRFPGNVSIATGVTALTYLDETIPSIGNYYYTVQTVNTDGNGGIATSNTVLLGAEGIVGVTIGTSTTLANNLPLNFYWKNSLSQSMYYASEIGLPGGAITAMVYKNDFVTNLPGKPVKFWVAETTNENLAGGWLAYDQFTLVYDGVLDFPNGVNEIMIPFNLPFVYTGGNLVIMAQRPMDTDYFNSNDRFFISETTSLPNRSIRVQSDSQVYDPTNYPTGQTASATFPNIQLYVSTAGMASLSGVVSDGTNPIAGATVSIQGNPVTQVTNAAGEYEFSAILAGTYSVTASKHGFVSSTLPITLEEEEEGELDFVLNAIPTVIVSGFVGGSDAPTVGLEGAVVTLEGYADYSATTDADGEFSISGVFVNEDYDITVSFAGYSNYTATVEVLEANLVLPNIILNEIANPAISVTAEEVGENAVINWLAPGSIVTSEFRYDSGVQDGQLGFQGGTANGVMGSVHRRNAIVNEISWFTTTEAGPHTTVNVFILALNASGMPTGNVLYSAMNVPNTDGQWTTHVLPTPVEAPNGFMLAMSYVGFLALATDIPNAQYPFVNNTHFYSVDYTAGTFATLESANFLKNFLLRAIGVDFGPAAKEFNPTIARKGVIGQGIEYIPSAQAVNVGEPTYALNSASSKALTGYNVYRLEVGQEGDEGLWVSLATGISEITYTDAGWNALTPAVYKYAVKAVYTNNVLSVPAFSNALAKAMTAPVTITITTNGGDAPTGAAVVLTNQDGNANHVYTATAPANGIVTFPEVWKGTYDLTVTKTGFEAYAQNDIAVNDAAQIGVELIEIIETPYNLEAEQIAAGKVMFSWNNAGNDFFEDFEGFADFATDLNPWTTITLNTSNTYGFTGITFPGSGTPFAYMAFNPQATTPPVDDMTAYSGERFAANFASTTAPDNSWLITPQVSIANNTVLKFMVKSFTAQYGLERYNVLVSTTDTQTSSFTKISTGAYLEAPATAWTEVTFDLSAYAGQNVYVAIQCVSNDAFVFMVDDVYIGAPNKGFTNYKVYLDGTEVATTTNLNHTFEGLAAGNYVAGVQAVYTSGVSEIVTLPFEVVEVETYNVTFVVKNENEEVIDDAVITFNGTAMAAGQYVVNDVEAGTYNYSISRDTYLDYTGTVTVVDQDITVNVVMIIDGIADYNNAALQVYPVPAKDQLNIVASENILNVKLVDLTGRVVYQNAQVGNSTLEVSVNHLNEGIYFVQIQTAKGLAVRKIQVVK